MVLLSLVFLQFFLEMWSVGHPGYRENVVLTEPIVVRFLPSYISM
jgi:hypothetical protein